MPSLGSPMAKRPSGALEVGTPFYQDGQLQVRVYWKNRGGTHRVGNHLAPCHVHPSPTMKRGAVTDSHSVEKREWGLEGANTINGAACRCGSRRRTKATARRRTINTEGLAAASGDSCVPKILCWFSSTGAGVTWRGGFKASTPPPPPPQQQECLCPPPPSQPRRRGNMETLNVALSG